VGKKLASMDAKTIGFGFEKFSLPDGHVATPAMNPHYGTNGTQNLGMFLLSWG